MGADFDLILRMLGNKERSDGSLATDRKAAVRPLIFVCGSDGGKQDALASKLKSILKLRTAPEK
jgi:hypothetical protein